MTVRRSIVAACCVATLAFGGIACSQSKDDSGATTNLDDVGPDLAKLRLEVDQLREEVRRLREEVAVLAPGATGPSTTTTSTSTSPLR